jgi:serine/threonine protein phosphatase PrpC
MHAALPASEAGLILGASAEEAFHSVDERWLKQQENAEVPDVSGSTATLVVHLDNTLHVAHVGDSRAVLCTAGVGAHAAEGQRPRQPETGSMCA